MSELEIIFSKDFWYHIDEDNIVYHIESLPLKTRLLNKFYHEIIEIFISKKNKLIFQKDENDMWILHTIPI